MKYVFVHFNHILKFLTCDWPWCLRWCSVDACHPQTWWRGWVRHHRSSPQTCCWWLGCFKSKNGQNYIILSKSLFYVHNSLYTLIKFCKPYHMIQNWSKVLWTITEWRSVYNLLKFFSSCNQIYMINYCKPIFICDYLILQLTSNKPVQGSWFCDKALSTSKSWRYKTIIVRSGSRREIFTMNML